MYKDRESIVLLDDGYPMVLLDDWILFTSNFIKSKPNSFILGGHISILRSVEGTLGVGTNVYLMWCS